MLRKIAFLLILLLIALPLAAQSDDITVIPLANRAPMIVLSPAGNYAAVWENSTIQNDDPDPELIAIRIIDLSTGEEITQLSGHQDYASSAVFTPDGEQLISYHQNGYIYLWNVATGERVREIPAIPFLRPQIALLPDGKTLAVTHPQRVILLWDLESGVITNVLAQRITYTEFMALREAQRGAIYIFTALASTPDGRIITADDYGNIELWSTADSTGISLVQSEEEFPGLPVRSFSLSEDGLSLVYTVQSRSNEVQVIEIPSGAEIARISAEERLVAAGISPDGTQLAWVMGEDAPVLYVAELSNPEAAVEVPLSSSDLGLLPFSRVQFIDNNTRIIIGGSGSNEESAIFIVPNPL